MNDIKLMLAGAADILRGAREYRAYLVGMTQLHDVGADHPEYDYRDTLYNAYSNALKRFDEFMGPIDATTPNTGDDA